MPRCAIRYRGLASRGLFERWQRATPTRDWRGNRDRRRIVDRRARGSAPVVGNRDTQDQACGRDHAGEPFVRRVLRHLSGRRRDPDARRLAHGVRSRPPDRGVCQAVPRCNGPKPRRTAQPPRRSTAGRWTASWRSHATAWPPRNAVRTTSRTLCVPTSPRSTSWATTTRVRSRTTGATARTLCSKTTCSSRSDRGACPNTCSWSRAGRRSARLLSRAAAPIRSAVPTRAGRWQWRCGRSNRAARRTSSSPGPTSPICCTNTM